MENKYDYLIVGAGIFGAVCARELTDIGKKVLVIDKRSHIGGNCYTEEIENIHVHKYGAHIFHTNDKDVWDWVNKFTSFNNYRHQVVANYLGEIYSLPFSMWTFSQMWGVSLPEEAQLIIESQKYVGVPGNLEEQALSLVGSDIYEKLVKHYTEKQWGKKSTELPTSIIKRLPVRFTYNSSYFDDKFQGIPVNGYTQMFNNILEGIDIKLSVDFFENKNELTKLAPNIIYTGPIDKFFDYKYGKLEYRTVKFENFLLDKENFQGCSVMNFTDDKTKYTRIIEHKHFDNKNQKKTYISYEYSDNTSSEGDPYYPINNEKNTKIYKSYFEDSKLLTNVYFGGRLAEYRYYDMHQVIASALKMCNTLK
jgi:UDP-galactopyranose mutase